MSKLPSSRIVGPVEDLIKARRSAVVHSFKSWKSTGKRQQAAFDLGQEVESIQTTEARQWFLDRHPNAKPRISSRKEAE